MLCAAGGPALWVAAEAGAFAAGTSWVPAVEVVAGPICHHDPARTPAVAGRLLPVCARCSGLHAGVAAGGLGALLVPLRRRPIRWAMGAGLAGTAVGFLAAVAEAAGWIATPNAARVVLGGLLGLGIPVIAVLGGRLMFRG